MKQTTYVSILLRVSFLFPAVEILIQILMEIIKQLVAISVLSSIDYRINVLLFFRLEEQLWGIQEEPEGRVFILYKPVNQSQTVKKYCTEAEFVNVQFRWGFLA